MLLVVTNKSDLASDYLIVKLKSKSIPFKRLNTEDFGREFNIEIVINKYETSFAIIFFDGIVLRESEISSVYFRQPNPPKLDGLVAETDKEFAEREAIELLRSIWRMIPEKKWLNHPKKLWIAVNKIEQLIAAKNIGFNIPKTLLSSYKDSVATFIEKSNDKVVAKAIKHGFQLRKDGIWIAMTQRLPSNYINQFETFANFPMTYQSEIEKNYDIRVVVVGCKIFATAIYSQEYEETAIDWRMGDLIEIPLRHEKIKLPNSLEKKCKKLVDHFSLQYSSMDFVLGKDGKYYFLELNPNGQWAWIEQLVNYPIRDAIIETLNKNNKNGSKKNLLRCLLN